MTAAPDTDAESRYLEAVARRDAIRDAWTAEGSPLLTAGSTGQLVEHPYLKMLRAMIYSSIDLGPRYPDGIAVPSLQQC